MKKKMNQNRSSSHDDDDAERSPKVRKLSTSPKKTSESPSRAEGSPKVSPRTSEKREYPWIRAIENMNLARQGLIPREFDLESIYLTKSFDVERRSFEADTPLAYDPTKVKLGEDKNGSLLSTVLTEVLSEPMNCAYFNEQELNDVYNVFSLSSEAQSLLARILKRRRGWHKIDSIQYPEIASDLKPIFRELVERNIFEDNTKNESAESLLNLLQVDQIRSLCKDLKVDHKATKPLLIKALAKIAERKRSLFPGMKTPSTALMEKINASLGECIRLAERSENLFNVVFVLLMPTQDPRENMADAFRTLAEVRSGEKMFPPAAPQRFPVFQDRGHLIDYAEAKGALNGIYKASETKDWETTRSLGRLALDRLKPVLERNQEEDVGPSSLPAHVKHFRANYVWTKVLWKSVEGFKKTKEGIELAANFLHSLIARRGEHLGNSARWHSELALIEMYHRKDLEASASVTLAGLSRDRLSDNDYAELCERARKLLGRNKNIGADTKKKLVEATRRKPEASLGISKPSENVIEATMVQGNTTGTKSTWSVRIGDGDVAYARVEEIALIHYSRKGFNRGLHCEGSLPVTLFAILFWNEIYQVPVPGAFVSSYQSAPLDLYGSNFLENRREEIENKLSLMRELEIESLSKIMSDDYAEYRHYSSLMQGNLFEDPNDLRCLIECLGKKGVLGICKRLANNYNQWKSGFPDLAVWNPIEKECKFVEVKGPGDSLSIKQKLWIEFLDSLGVKVEVCIVNSTTRKYAM